MTDKSDNRKLTLAKPFNAAGTSLERTISEQIGYVKVDDLTVLERKLIPIMTSDRNPDLAVLRIDVYDFNNYTVTNYSKSIGGTEEPLSHTMRDFSQIEGKNAIRDAHRALVELGGCPPSLDEIMQYVVELQKNVSVSAPLRLTKSGPG